MFDEVFDESIVGGCLKVEVEAFVFVWWFSFPSVDVGAWDLLDHC